MSLLLTSSDVAQIETALTAFLSPLEHETPEAWGAAMLQQLMPLLGADQAFFAMPMDGVWHGFGYGAHTEEAHRAYVDYFWRVDRALTQRRTDLGLEVHHRDMLYKPGEMEHDELHNDWCVPHRLLDTLGMVVQVNPTPISSLVHFYHERESTPSFGDRGVALLRLMLPAFRAGAHARFALAEHRGMLARTLDEVSDAVALFDARGKLMHENGALRRLLADEPQRVRLISALQSVAVRAGMLARRRSRMNVPLEDGASEMTTNVRTASAAYEVRVALIREAMLAAPASVVVIVRPVAPRLLSDQELRARYRLTQRECTVARLIASGRTDRAVADALSISWHTARRHGERVLAKLAVHARSAVGPKLRTI